jgi:hypothetical protein
MAVGNLALAAKAVRRGPGNHGDFAAQGLVLDKFNAAPIPATPQLLGMGLRYFIIRAQLLTTSRSEKTPWRKRSHPDSR